MGLHQRSVLSPFLLFSVVVDVEILYVSNVKRILERQWNRKESYSKQCSLVRSCVVERGWSCLEKGIRFRGYGSKKKAWLKRTQKKQIEKESINVGLRRKDALCCSKWSVSVNKIAAGLRCIWPRSLVGNSTRFYILVALYLSV